MKRKKKEKVIRRWGDLPNDYDPKAYFEKQTEMFKVYSEKMGSIMTIAVQVEFHLEEIILKYYLGKNSVAKEAFRDEFFEGAVSFLNKIHILNHILERENLLEGKYKGIIRELERLNTTRNEFAHNTIVNSKAILDGEIKYIELSKGLSDIPEEGASSGKVIRYSIKDLEKMIKDFMSLFIACHVLYGALHNDGEASLGQFHLDEYINTPNSTSEIDRKPL